MVEMETILVLIYRWAYSVPPETTSYKPTSKPYLKSRPSSSAKHRRKSDIACIHIPENILYIGDQYTCIVHNTTTPMARQRILFFTTTATTITARQSNFRRHAQFNPSGRWISSTTQLDASSSWMDKIKGVITGKKSTPEPDLPSQANFTLLRKSPQLHRHHFLSYHMCVY